MGTESVPEVLENTDTLTGMSAREDIIECWYDSPVTRTQIRVEILYTYIYWDLHIYGTSDINKSI
jgi:hypothetical protein